MTVTLFGICEVLGVLCGGMLLQAFSFSASSFIGAGAPGAQEVGMEDAETGEDANEDGEEEGEQ